MSNNITPIFGRLKNVTKENPYVAGAVDIKDDVKDKDQQVINQETDEHFNLHDTEIADRYTKEEVNNIVSRIPETDVIVIDVPSEYQSDIADYLDANTPSGTDPETGKSVRANKLYRVPGPDNTTFSEWAWNGTAYIMLANKDYGFDEEPVLESTNLLNSGRIALNLGYSQDNSEYLRVYTDANNKFLFGIKIDGSVEWAKGIPTPIKNAILKLYNYVDEKFNGMFKVVSSPDYIYAVVDADEHFLFGITTNGEFKTWKGDTPDETWLDDWFMQNSNPEDKIAIIIDKNDKVLSYRDKNGVLHEHNVVIENRLDLGENAIISLRAILNKNNQWLGKKIVWLGTSIPYGQTSESGVSNPMPNPYPKIVAEKLSATVINTARPGMAVETNADGTRKEYGSLSLSISELTEQGYPITPYQSYENAMLGHNADLYVFDCEPNNSDGDTSILDDFDFANWRYLDNSTFASHRSNYIGAILFMLDKLWTEKPSAVVVFVSEYGNTTVSGWNTSYAIRNATIALAEKLKIPVINLWEKLGYNNQNWSLYVNSDHVHPKVAAHVRMGNILANELLLIS